MGPSTVSGAAFTALLACIWTCAGCGYDHAPPMPRRYLDADAAMYQEMDTLVTAEQPTVAHLVGGRTARRRGVYLHLLVESSGGWPALYRLDPETQLPGGSYVPRGSPERVHDLMLIDSAGVAHDLGQGVYWNAGVGFGYPPQASGVQLSDRGASITRYLVHMPFLTEREVAPGPALLVAGESWREPLNAGQGVPPIQNPLYGRHELELLPPQ